MIKTIILLLAFTLSSCSYGLVTTKEDNPVQCSTQYLLPVADSLLLIPMAYTTIVLPMGAAYACSWGRCEDADVLMFSTIWAMSLAANILLGKSAYYGYTQISKCRNSLKEGGLRRLSYRDF